MKQGKTVSLQTEAVDLLFTLPPDEVARRLEIRLSTLRRWLKQPEFLQELRGRYTEKHEAAKRIALQASLAAARAVESWVNTGEDKGTAKAAVDLMKSGGLLDLAAASASADAADDQLTELVRLVNQEED
jgi:hypothetical protein